MDARRAANLLKITFSASQNEKKAAFRALAKVWHPDLHQGKPTAAEAERKFKEILMAYEIVQKASPADFTADADASGSSGWRSSVYRGSGMPRAGMHMRYAKQQNRQRSSAYDDFSARSQAYYANVEAKEREPGYVLAPAAFFFLGLIAFGVAKWNEGSATQKHNHNWISRRSNGGWGGSSRSVGATAAESSSSTSKKPKVGGEGGLPRWSRPYYGGSATAAKGVRIGDDLPRDWASQPKRQAAGNASGAESGRREYPADASTPR